MAQKPLEPTFRRGDFHAVLWYTLTALWLGIYLAVTLLSGLHHPVAPLLRITLLLLACLCAYLGARLPRPGETSPPPHGENGFAALCGSAFFSTSIWC